MSNPALQARQARDTAKSRQRIQAFRQAVRQKTREMDPAADSFLSKAGSLQSLLRGGGGGGPQG